MSRKSKSVTAYVSGIMYHNRQQWFATQDEAVAHAIAEHENGNETYVKEVIFMGDDITKLVLSILNDETAVLERVVGVIEETEEKEAA